MITFSQSNNGVSPVSSAIVNRLYARADKLERAWALVLYYVTEEDYEWTSALLASRFEAPVSRTTLRQWKSRYFAQGIALLEGLREEFGPP